MLLLKLCAPNFLPEIDAIPFPAKESRIPAAFSYQHWLLIVRRSDYLNVNNPVLTCLRIFSEHFAEIIECEFWG